MMETMEWNKVLILPASSPPGARMITAVTDDGGELRAGVAVGPHGGNVLEIGYCVVVDVKEDDPIESEKLARWPTLEEIYSALDELLEPGAVVTMSLVRGQDREGPLKVLTMTQIGKVVPQLDGGSVQ